MITLAALIAIAAGLTSLCLELDARHYFDHLDLVGYADAYDTIERSTR